MLYGTLEGDYSVFRCYLLCERRGRSSSIVTLTPSVRQRYGLASIGGSSHKKIIRHLIAKRKRILETITGVIQEN